MNILVLSFVKTVCNITTPSHPTSYTGINAHIIMKKNVF